MKLVSVLLTVSALFFLGCASSPKVAEPAVVIVKEIKKEPVKTVTTVFYPVKEESYFGDGTKDEYRVFTYDNGGISLLKEELFNADDKLQEFIITEYPDAASRVRKFYDADGTLKRYEEIAVDSDGNIIKIEKFDNKDNLQSVSKYEYQNGLKLIWNVYSSSLSLLSTTNYIYTDNLLTRIENLSAGAEMEEYFVLKYNADGMLLEEVHYNTNGNIEDSRSFEYEDGYLSMEQQHRKNGSVLRKIMYKNDKFGNPVETVFMDAGDNVQERLVYMYGSREVISYEK